MIELLSKKFIKNYENVKDPKVRTAYGYLCAVVGIMFNILLFAGKFIAGSIAGSVAVTADAFNNLSDAGSSIISLIGFKLASQKPDPEHPFGHGRYEYIASLVISGIIFVIAFELGRESVEKIIHPVDVSYSLLTVVILAVSVAVKLYMYLYNKKTGEKIDSQTMRAIAADSISDAVSTGAVLVCAIIGIIADVHLDGFMGLAVAFFIARTGYEETTSTLDLILGGPPDKEFVDSIEKIVMSHDGIMGIHDMMVHNYGPGRTFISLHAEVPADGDILAIHDLIDNIEGDIIKETGCLATIHMDPIDVRSEEREKAFNTAKKVLASIDEKITFHDFRIVSGPTHTNLIFDVVVPFGYPIDDAALKKKIFMEINAEEPTYFCVIKVDKDFLNK